MGGTKKMPIDLSLLEGHILKLELIVVDSLFIRIKSEQFKDDYFETAI